MTTFLPGNRVMVFDSRIYKDDRTTPDCIKLATVVRWYGTVSKRFGRYPSLIDVVFDHDGRESRGHFANDIYVKIIQFVSRMDVFYCSVRDNLAISNLSIRRITPLMIITLTNDLLRTRVNLRLKSRKLGRSDFDNKHRRYLLSRRQVIRARTALLFTSTRISSEQAGILWTSGAIGVCGEHGPQMYEGKQIKLIPLSDDKVEVEIWF